MESGGCGSHRGPEEVERNHFTKLGELTSTLGPCASCVRVRNIMCHCDTETGALSHSGVWWTWRLQRNGVGHATYVVYSLV